MRFVIYLFTLVLIELVFYVGSFFLFPETIHYFSYYLLVGLVLILIFVSKFIFLYLTKSIQQSKPESWVNANLLAFAAKFILIIGLMFLLSLFVENGAKSIIIWTAILYVSLLVADIMYDLKFTDSES